MKNTESLMKELATSVGLDIWNNTSKTGTNIATAGSGIGSNTISIITIIASIRVLYPSEEMDWGYGIQYKIVPTRSARIRYLFSWNQKIKVLKVSFFKII